MKCRKYYSLLLIAPLMYLLNGCASNAPYHTLNGDTKNCVIQPSEKSCFESYYQEYDAFDLAFAEFTERGNAFSDVVEKNVLDRINKQATNDDGIILITFIHGWKHNASESDPNLRGFKDSLRTISNKLKENFGYTLLGKRRLVGLYIGWRGANIEIPILEEFTFWDRKAVSEEVGKGGVTRLLLELDKAVNRKHDYFADKNLANGDKSKNVMVVVGHSFGGAIVVSALNEILMERAVNPTKKNRFARTLGDGVVLLNPAIEANQALDLVQATLQHGYNDGYNNNQHPLLISLSSDADWATHYAFPIGQTLGLWANWRQTDLERKDYYDREYPTQAATLKEENLDTTTVGNFAPYLTHHLTISNPDGNCKFKFETCNENPSACEPKGLTSLTGQPSFHTPQNYPLYFIRTDDSIMDDHSDIFNPRVRSFIYTVIDDIIAYKLDSRPLNDRPQSILTFLNKNNFEQDMRNNLIRDDVGNLNCR